MIEFQTIKYNKQLGTKLQKNYWSIIKILWKETSRLSRKNKNVWLEVVSLDLTTEYLSIDSECQLFRKIPESIKSKIERSVFNHRRRKIINLYRAN